MKEVKKVDMHMHSIHSDGTHEPLELLEIAKKKNVTIMALTDHDNIEGSKELVKYNDKDISIYSGVELTAKVPKGRMHILGYNIDLDNPDLNQTLKEMKEASIYNLLLYIEIIKKDFGIILPQAEIDNLINSKSNIGRPQLARLLLKYGYCKSINEAFDAYLSHAYEKVRKIKRGLTKEEAIDLINASGGVASLAHPSSLCMDNEELFAEIKYLKSIGLSSIEVIHINNNPLQRKYYHELAKYFDLLESGGTDFHGLEVKPDVEMVTGRNFNVDINENTLSLTKKIKNRYIK